MLDTSLPWVPKGISRATVDSDFRVDVWLEGMAGIGCQCQPGSTNIQVVLKGFFLGVLQAVACT
jgi:hypothetical protein